MQCLRITLKLWLDLKCIRSIEFDTFRGFWFSSTHLCNHIFYILLLDSLVIFSAGHFHFFSEVKGTVCIWRFAFWWGSRYSSFTHNWVRVFHPVARASIFCFWKGNYGLLIGNLDCILTTCREILLYFFIFCRSKLLLLFFIIILGGMDRWLCFTIGQGFLKPHTKIYQFQWAMRSRCRYMDLYATHVCPWVPSVGKKSFPWSVRGLFWRLCEHCRVC